MSSERKVLCQCQPMVRVLHSEHEDDCGFCEEDGRGKVSCSREDPRRESDLWTGLMGRQVCVRGNWAVGQTSVPGVVDLWSSDSIRSHRLVVGRVMQSITKVRELPGQSKCNNLSGNSSRSLDAKEQDRTAQAKRFAGQRWVWRINASMGRVV